MAEFWLILLQASRIPSKFGEEVAVHFANFYACRNESKKYDDINKMVVRRVLLYKENEGKEGHLFARVHMLDARNRNFVPSRVYAFREKNKFAGEICFMDEGVH